MKLPRLFPMALPAAVALSWTLSGGPGFAQEPPEFEGAGIPAPPAQIQPWIAPPSRLPPEAMRAMAELFTVGFADPRGCEYREVVLRRPLGFGRKPEDEGLPARGWVLPPRADDATRYAVYWDGLVYPLISIGAPSDLDADIGNILKEQPRPDQTLIKIPLLIRLGKIEAAEKIWQWWAEQNKKGLEDEAEKEGADPFANLATVWLRAAHERVLRPHLHSRPKLALAYLQLLPDFRAGVEKLVTQRGIELAKAPVKHRRPGTLLLDLTFLNQVPVLIADEQRRIRENISDRDEQYAPDTIADKKQRIALLVRDLEDVEAHQMVMPGYLDFGFTPVVQALIRQGEDAVDPLLDCLENDQRLTRSVDTLRVVGVEEPALVALQGILKTTEQFAWLNTPRGYGFHKLDRPALVAQIREYWNKLRGRTLPQRWLAILADDTARPEAWAEVARNIALKETTEIPVAGFFRFNVPSKPGEVIHLRGESLRGETNPSVSELMVKRLRETLANAKTSESSFPFTPSRELAMALGKWDGRNQIETLRWYCGELQGIAARQKENAGPGQIDDLIKTYLARAKLGDVGALGEYAQWMRAAEAGKLEKLGQSYGATYFAPVWLFPTDPAIADLTRWLFADPQSPWSLGAASTDSGWVASSTHLPLMAVPAFRTVVLKQLKDEHVVGKVERTPPDGITVTRVYGHSGPNTDPEAPPVGFKADLRVCDFTAMKISEIRGAPAFKPYWPLDRRTRAIQDTAAFVSQYGDRLFRAAAEDDDSVVDEAVLQFPTLDHPATREDVASGRAIFTLEGKGERRVVPLLQYPAYGTWPALKDYPSLMQTNDPVTKQPVTNTRFDQDGRIWQAEEVLVDGKWQRYFGFVGRNCLAMVRAEEIYFGPSGCADRFDGWEMRVSWPGKFDAPALGRRTLVRVGDPMPMTISAFNSRGIDRPFPKAPAAPRSTNADDIGLEVGVEYSPRPRAAYFTYPPLPEPKWAPVALVDGGRPVELPASQGALSPVRGMPLVKFDLAKWYDLKEPGTYRVAVKFKQGGLFGAETTASIEYLEIRR